MRKKSRQKGRGKEAIRRKKMKRGKREAMRRRKEQ